MQWAASLQVLPDWDADLMNMLSVENDRKTRCVDTCLHVSHDI